jgi:hypothetical protein
MIVPPVGAVKMLAVQVYVVPVTLFGFEIFIGEKAVPEQEVTLDDETPTDGRG